MKVNTFTVLHSTLIGQLTACIEYPQLTSVCSGLSTGTEPCLLFFPPPPPPADDNLASSLA